MPTAPQPSCRHALKGGFTLLELCIVLFIMVLLAGVATPALHSALIEQALRNDESRLATTVRTAMLSSSEQQSTYVLKLDGKSLLLEKAAVPETAGETDPPTDPDNSAPASETKVMLSHGIQFPDATKKNGWDVLPTASWQFVPHGLCPLPRLRIEDGSAYIEVSFNALTGDVEDEALSVP